MQSSFGKIVLTVLALIVGLVAINWVFHLALSLFWMALPVLMVGGVVYVLYQVYGRKALGGGRRILP